MGCGDLPTWFLLVKPKEDALFPLWVVVEVPFDDQPGEVIGSFLSRELAEKLVNTRNRALV